MSQSEMLEYSQISRHWGANITEKGELWKVSWMYTVPVGYLKTLGKLETAVHIIGSKPLRCWAQSKSQGPSGTNESSKTLRILNVDSKNSDPIRLVSLDVSVAPRCISELGERRPPPRRFLHVQRKSGFHRKQSTLSRSAHLCDVSQAGKVPPKQPHIQLYYQKQTTKTKTPSSISARGAEAGIVQVLKSSWEMSSKGEIRIV